MICSASKEIAGFTDSFMNTPEIILAYKTKLKRQTLLVAKHSSNKFRLKKKRKSNKIKILYRRKWFDRFFCVDKISKQIAIITQPLLFKTVIHLFFATQEQTPTRTPETKGYRPKEVLQCFGLFWVVEVCKKR